MTEELAPVIFRQGKRLYLRPLEKGDLPFFVRSMNDPEVTRFLTICLPVGIEDEEEWFERQRKNRDESLVFAIVLKEGNQLIGSMGFHRIDHLNGTAMTGSAIGKKECWGKGYGTEAKMLLLEYAFNTLNLRKVCSAAYAPNERSIGCLKRCGYKEEGRLRAQHFINGEYVDDVLLAVFRNEWLPLWAKYHKEHLS